MANANFPPLRSPLPEALALQDGTPVTTAQQWREQRRGELLELFREHVFGHPPVEQPAAMRFEVVNSSKAFDGRAIRQEVTIHCSGPFGESVLPLSLYIPANVVKARGCFLFFAVRDSGCIRYAETKPGGFWPVAEILARGYATAAIAKNDAAPDDKDTSFGGVFAAYESGGDAAHKPRTIDAADATRETRAANAWGSIAAWAWSCSRAIDYLQSVPALRALKIALAGHSRGGKTALWCGAQDERVALAVSNNSGCTGAALSRSTRGESVEAINTRFPHWFARNYRRYNDNVAALPVDQHQLLALLAPRLAYVASASEDAWADPQSEFHAVHASGVSRLHGQAGLVANGFPVPGQPLHEGSIGYHLRAGKHDLVLEDWLHFIDFADRHWHGSAASA